MISLFEILSLEAPTLHLLLLAKPSFKQCEVLLLSSSYKPVLGWRGSTFTTVMAIKTSYNWLFQWDYTFYKWGFLSTCN